MTYKFGLIGYPITHSLSPWIHENFLKETELKGSYSILEINPEDSFTEAMSNLKAANLDGFNVTVPYKEKIIEYLDEIDEQAEKIGAVNTVLCQHGKWIGYNTDGIGYMRALLNRYPEVVIDQNEPVLLLGAGGAAKGILHALLYNGYENITIANRSLKRAHELAAAHDTINVVTLEQAEEELASYAIVIQTTSVGMKPHETDQVISLKNLTEATVVSDIVYQPLKTALLQEAEQRGARIHFGHSMLLYQAQYAFEIWTGKRPEMDELDEGLKKQLEG